METNDELDQFLLEIAKSNEEDSQKSTQNLRDDDTFAKELDSCASTSTATTAPTLNQGTSLIHENNTLDSSDDEDLKNFLEQKYNEYGRDVQSRLKKQNEERVDLMVTQDVERSIQKTNAKPFASKVHQFPEYSPKPVTSTTKSENVGVYTDPIFGIRIVHPLISSAQIQERMNGRIAVPMSSLRKHLDHGDLSKDWAVAGVIVKKSAIFTSKKGAHYVIWKLSDLRGEIKTISLFLFKNAYKQMWKTAQGKFV